MTGPFLVFALGGLALASGQGEGRAPVELRCVAGDISSPVWVTEVNRMFAQRALEVVRAAIASDRTALARLVSPDARFTMWRGDSGTGRHRGVEGALEFARHMNASQFEYFISHSGPISSDPCGVQNAEILFFPAAGDQGYRVQFRFERGLLARVEGLEGEVRRDALDSRGRPRG